MEHCIFKDHSGCNHTFMLGKFVLGIPFVQQRQAWPRNQAKGDLSEGGFCKRLRLSWPWPSECQMYTAGSNILGYFLFPWAWRWTRETLFAKTPSPWFLTNITIWGDTAKKGPFAGCPPWVPAQAASRRSASAPRRQTLRWSQASSNPNGVNETKPAFDCSACAGVARVPPYLWQSLKG